jgi:hypothetical protein
VADSGFILPGLEDPAARPFWDGTERGELLLQACADCDKPRFPPRPMCFHCRSVKVKWVKASGRGTVWSFVVPHPPLLPAYAEQAPYNVIVVARGRSVDHPHRRAGAGGVHAGRGRLAAEVGAGLSRATPAPASPRTRR